MLYVFIYEDEIRVSSENPDNDFETALDESFVAKYGRLSAEYGNTPVQNVLRNGGAAVEHIV